MLNGDSSRPLLLWTLSRVSDALFSHRYPYSVSWMNAKAILQVLRASRVP